jgi:hypothetical protein
VAFERNTKSVVVLNFSGGQGISVFDWRDGDGIVEAIKGGSAQRGAARDPVFGEGTVRSDYELISRTLNVTPADLRIFSSRQKMVGNSVLLRIKRIDLPRIKHGVYSFQTNSFRGFQKGDPLQDATVIIKAFDAQDHKIQLWIGAKPDASPKLTQADINRILYSLGPVSTAQVQ